MPSDEQRRLAVFRALARPPQIAAIHCICTPREIATMSVIAQQCAAILIGVIRNMDRRFCFRRTRHAHRGVRGPRAPPFTSSPGLLLSYNAFAAAVGGTKMDRRKMMLGMAAGAVVRPRITVGATDKP